MIRSHHSCFLVMLTLAWGTGASAVVLESWQFNETAGTQFTGLVNSVGSATFSGDKAQAATDGLGALKFTQGADAIDNVFRNATLTSKDQTSGLFELNFTLLSANLSTGDASGANVGFGMRDESGVDLFVVRLQKLNSKLLLQTRINNVNGTLVDFGAGVTSLTDTLNVRAVADLDTRLLDVYYTVGLGTEQTAGLGIDIGFDPLLQFDEVRLIANTNTADWGVMDTVRVDYLTVSAQLPPPPAATLEVNTTTGIVTIKNLSGSNLALDYYEITSAASLNPAGWNSLEDQNLPGFPAGNGTGNGWEELGLNTPAADFNLDEVVNGQDLAQWGADYGVNGNSDADGDADTDGADFLAWQRTVGETASPQSTLLAEGYLLGNSTLNAGASLALGNAFQVGAAQDLAFRIRQPDGTILVGDVQYTSGGALTAVPEPSGLLLVLLALGVLFTGTRTGICNMICFRNIGLSGYAVVLAIGSLALVSGETAAAPDRTRPNILFVYADDMGIGDTSAYSDIGNNPDNYQIATPNMERLASMGTRFTDVHTAEAVCSPSRISLLTGRYSFRSDLKQLVGYTGQDIHSTLFTQGGKQTKSVGNLLQDVGYQTYGFGKWHLGVETDSSSIDTSRTLLEGPTHVGFDHYVGTLGNPGGIGQLIEDDKLVKFTSTLPGDLTTAPLSGSDTPSTNWVINNDDGALQQGKLTQRHLNAAKSYMDDHLTGGAHENDPFFIYYASHANHAPYYAGASLETDADGTPTTVPITGNTVAGGPIRVITGPDNNGDGLPDPIDPQYPSTAFDNAEGEGWLKYYAEDEFGNQIENPASRRADMVHENDIVLGELMDYLEANDDPRNPGAKLIDNTLIIFTSDNGANLDGPAVGALPQVSDDQVLHLRGKKGTPWEGGTRVPFIAAWAGEIQEGMTSDALFGQADLYATFAELTGQTMQQVYADTEGADSESVLDALLGTATGVVRESDLLYKRKAELILRRGNLKLVVTESDFNGSNVRIDPGGVATGLNWQDLVAVNLYDLSNDLDETVNLVNDPAWAAVRDSMLLSLMQAIGPDAEAGFSRGLFGDINHDSVLDAADWRIFRAGLGKNLTGKTDLAAYTRGDLDGDLDVDINDFSLFKRAYDLANGTGAFAAMTQAVPEPASVCLVSMIVGCLAFSRRRRA